jgi:hypothetical protein
MSAESPPAETVENRRPWYRLHVSTLLVLLLAAGLLVLTVVPGDFEDMVFFDSGAFFADQGRVEHGWPGVYLRRVTVYPSSGPPRPELGIPWLAEEAWELSGEQCEFWPATLALDVAAALAILAALGTAVEWRRRRHHRAWQFSLGEILLLTLFIAGALGWWQYNRLCLQRERELGSIAYPEFAIVAEGQFDYRGPIWLRRLAGAGNLTAFHRVTGLYLGCAALEDDNLRHHVQRIRALTCLESLWIDSLHVTNDGLAHVAQLPQLRELSLSTPLVTNAGLTHLQALPRLEGLYLQGTAVTDDGMKHLSGLTNLRWLSLKGTAVSESGLTHISKLKSLEFVVLPVGVSDESIRRLEAQLPECEIVQGGL